MTVENQLIMNQLKESLQQLSERLTELERRTSDLEHPQLMYRPPKSDEYQTIAQTLDYLYNTVEDLNGSTIH